MLVDFYKGADFEYFLNDWVTRFLLNPLLWRPTVQMQGWHTKNTALPLQ